MGDDVPAASEIGVRFSGTIDPAYIDKVAADHEALGEHLWVMTALYGLTAQEAAHATEGTTTLLDRDHLLHLSQMGCYVCEKTYTHALKDVPCKGSPAQYGPTGEPYYADGTTHSGGRWR